MIIKSIEPIKELDLCQVIHFRIQKLVTIQRPLDKETTQNLVLAKYSDGKSYVVENFGTNSLRAKNCVNRLQQLLSVVCGIGARSTVDVSPQQSPNE